MGQRLRNAAAFALCVAAAFAVWIGVLVSALRNPSTDTSNLGAYLVAGWMALLMPWFVPGWWRVLRAPLGRLRRPSLTMIAAGLGANAAAAAAIALGIPALVFIAFPTAGAVGSLICWTGEESRRTSEAS